LGSELVALVWVACVWVACVWVAGHAWSWVEFLS
jgi:hypothetical protein